MNEKTRSVFHAVLTALSAVLAAGGLGVSAYIAYALLANPLDVGRALGYILLCLAAAVGLNRSLALWQGAAASPRGKKALRISKWILPLAVPFVLFGFLESHVAARGIEVVRESVGPLVTRLEDRSGTDGNLPDDLLEALRGATGIEALTVFAGDGRFVVAVAGGSIDLDGSTIFHAASQGDWEAFHNDLLEPGAAGPAKAYSDAIAGLTRTRYRKVGDEWERVTEE